MIAIGIAVVVGAAICGLAARVMIGIEVVAWDIASGDLNRWLIAHGAPIREGRIDLLPLPSEK